jgi:hypothetical protein
MTSKTAPYTIAADKRCIVAQLSLACLLAQGPDVIPIPGTMHVERLEENLGGLDIRLTPEAYSPRPPHRWSGPGLRARQGRGTGATDPGRSGCFLSGT